MRLPILVFHICAGTIGLLSGAVGIAVRKGSRQHRVAGNVFFVSMLSLAVSAVYLSFMKHQISNVFGGTLTFYMVATAWLTARRREGGTGIFDYVALLVALAVGVCEVTYGSEAALSPTGLKDGYSPGVYFGSGFVALLAVTGDVRMIVRGGIFGAQRIARHVWRMCIALFVASGSFFLGQQQVFPAAVRNTPILPILTFLPIVIMIFWLLRVGLTKAYKGKWMPRGGDGSSLQT